MILQPLVENSFKHSRLVSDPNGFVHFYLIQENNGLMFIARNSVKGMSLSVVDQNKKTHSGIGLENVKKRLELYYGNNYSFEAKQEDDKYVVTIKIGEKYNEKNV
jgi:sensor histidine kinase YesM